MQALCHAAQVGACLCACVCVCVKRRHPLPAALTAALEASKGHATGVRGQDSTLGIVPLREVSTHDVQGSGLPPAS